MRPYFGLNLKWYTWYFQLFLSPFLFFLLPSAQLLAISEPAKVRVQSGSVLRRKVREISSSSIRHYFHPLCSHSAGGYLQMTHCLEVYFFLGSFLVDSITGYFLCKSLDSRRCICIPSRKLLPFPQLLGNRSFYPSSCFWVLLSFRAHISSRENTLTLTNPWRRRLS